MHFFSQPPARAPPWYLKPLCKVKTWYHTEVGYSVRNRIQIKLWRLNICCGLAHCLHKTCFCPADTFVFLPLSRYKREKERERKQNHLSVFTPKLHSPQLIFQLPFLFISLLCSSLYSALICAWLNEQLNSKGVTMQNGGQKVGWGREEEAGGRGGKKTCGCRTSSKSLPSQPFNSLSSKVQSLTNKANA